MDGRPALHAHPQRHESLTTLYQNLAKELGIGKYAQEPDDGDDDRPDLVFLLGNEASGRLVIVELKAPNVSLDNDHLAQLRSYMKRARDGSRQTRRVSSSPFRAS